MKLHGESVIADMTQIDNFAAIFWNKMNTPKIIFEIDGTGFFIEKF